MDGKQVVYLNGRFVERGEATMDIEDRGAMFGDGVYEVTRYYNGRPLAMEGHMKRLANSLAGIALEAPADVARLPGISDELVRLNQCPEAGVYWQITRGPAVRKHAIPERVNPTVMAMAYPVKAFNPAAPPPGLTAITVEDVRWQLCSIKSLMLLPNVLAKREAMAAGADDAILHRGDTVTESTSSNVMVVQGGELWTHPADRTILGGITRGILLALAPELGLTVREEKFTVADLLAAQEVMISGTVTELAAITRVNGQLIGGGHIGPVARRLREAFVRHVVRECGLAQS